MMRWMYALFALLVSACVDRSAAPGEGTDGATGTSSTTAEPMTSTTDGGEETTAFPDVPRYDLPVPGDVGEGGDGWDCEPPAVLSFPNDPDDPPEIRGFFLSIAHQDCDPLRSAAGPVGDFNADGLADIAFAIVCSDAAELRLYVLLGSEDPCPDESCARTLSSRPDWFRIDGGEDWGIMDEMPRIAPVGDFNGDEVDDFLLAIGDDGFVVYGRDCGAQVCDLQTTIAEIHPDVSEGSAGRPIGAESTLTPLFQLPLDFDGDGLGDVAVAVRPVRGTPNAADEVRIYYGGPHGEPLARTAIQLPAGLQLPLAFAEVDGMLGAAGDFNGDGFDDLAIAVRDADSSGQRVVIHYGSAGRPGTLGLLTDAATLHPVNPDGEILWMAASPSIDADDADDLLLLAGNENACDAERGYVVFSPAEPGDHGLADLVDNGAAVPIDSAFPYVPERIEPAGDLDHDEVPDVAVTAIALDCPGQAVAVPGGAVGVGRSIIAGSTLRSSGSIVIGHPDYPRELFTVRLCDNEKDGSQFRPEIGYSTYPEVRLGGDFDGDGNADALFPYLWWHRAFSADLAVGVALHWDADPR